MNESTPAERYAAGLNKIETDFHHSFPYVFSADKPGRRYTRVVQEVGGRTSVHAFVENETGHVFKAAGWSTPAKGVRFQTVEDALSRARVNPYQASLGGYLYMNRKA